MAKFLLGNNLRHVALDNAALRQPLWLLDAALIGAALGVFRALPVRWASALGARGGRLLGRVAKERNLHVRANLTLALPDRPAEEIDRLAGAVWENAGAVLAELPNLGRIGNGRSDFLTIESEALMSADGEIRQPMVFVAAHLANWEVIGAAITRLGIRSRAMYAPLANPWLDHLLLGYRKALGCDLVARSEGLRPFMDALKEGLSPIIIADRRIQDGGGKPIAFFGAQKQSSTLPARLALRFGVPLVPVQVERRPGARFHVRFHAPLAPRDPADPAAQALDLTAQTHEMFEHWITARPGEWLCTSKMWPSSVLRDKTDVYESV